MFYSGNVCLFAIRGVKDDSEIWCLQLCSLGCYLFLMACSSLRILFFFFPMGFLAHIVAAHVLKLKGRKSSIHYHVINSTEPAGSKQSRIYLSVKTLNVYRCSSSESSLTSVFLWMLMSVIPVTFWYFVCFPVVNSSLVMPLIFSKVLILQIFSTTEQWTLWRFQFLQILL